MKKTWLNGYVYDFSADYNTIDVNDTVDIRKYFVKKAYFSVPNKWGGPTKVPGINKQGGTKGWGVQQKYIDLNKNYLLALFCK